ncbi:hypothetical protein IAU60_006345 [Kwoniella sp. DSM 27419]
MQRLSSASYVLRSIVLPYVAGVGGLGRGAIHGERQVSHDASARQLRTREYLGMAPKATTSSRTHTSTLALQRILDGYSGKGKERATIPEEILDTPTPAPVASSAPASAADPTPDLPPYISRLLDARLFRLTVFHLLQTPAYATNGPLLLFVADHLEEKGAGKLARRLRRGWEMRDGRGTRLWSDPVQGRLAPGHWQIPNLPPRPDTQDMTQYYNAHLLYLLTRPSLASTPTSPTPRINDWPAPAPNLQQLRKLLTTIAKLENKGFVPDCVTANLILKCWLRSASARSRPHDPIRLHRDAQGKLKPARKVDSEHGLRREELRGLFDLISRVISSTARPLEPGLGPGPGPEPEPEPGSEPRAGAWNDRVRPFGRLIIRSMKATGDVKGVKRVIDWMRRERARLGMPPSDEI